jgi:hypothetical protein
LNLILDSAGYLLVSVKISDILASDIAILSSLFSLISIITLVIFFRGQARGPESQTQHTLFAIGLKFLLEMVLALVWFIVIKKTSLKSVFIFFVIYLTLTLFSLLVIFKTLKYKSLHNKT